MRTLGDLGLAHRLRVSCPCVATVRSYSPGPLIARFGPDLALTDLAARFRCKRCGERG